MLDFIKSLFYTLVKDLFYIIPLYIYVLYKRIERISIAIKSKNNIAGEIISSSITFAILIGIVIFHRSHQHK